MESTLIETTLDRIRAALEAGRIDEAIRALSRLHPADRAEALADLHPDHQAEVLDELPPNEAADILEDLEDEEAAEVAARLPPATLADVLDEMAPDEAADVLGDLPKDVAASALAQMEEAAEVIPLLGHPDETAGGLMTTSFIALRRFATAQQAIEFLRQVEPGEEMQYYLYVVDREQRLIGVVGLRDLVVASPETRIETIMDRDVISVPVGIDQEDVARVMTRYDLAAVPVVDEDRRLVGVITFDDVADVIEDEATEDIQRLGGAQPLDRPYLDTPILSVTGKRIGWLLLLFITESLTGSVLRHFERELASVVALSFFIPLLIGTGGNAGSQTTTTIIRALAVGQLDLKDALRALWHELRLGLLLGLAMGAIGFARALLWGTSSDLALTVSVSILTIIVWANALGALLPLLAARLKIDPTVVSGPAMSTLVDATGLFIYFTIAKILIGL